MTRQRKWQIMRIKEGNCSQCGKLRNLYAIWCDKCGVLHRKRKQRYRGNKPWKIGMPGTMPFDMKAGTKYQRTVVDPARRLATLLTKLDKEKSQGVKR